MKQQDFHIVQRIRHQVDKYRERTALRDRQQDGQWVDISWSEFGRRIDQLSLALLAKGVEVQDKIAIFSPNMPEWTIADMATLQLRAIVVPIYPTNTAEQSRYILEHADVSILFVGEQLQFDIAAEVFDQCPTLKLIVAMDDSIDMHAHPHAISLTDFSQTDGPLASLQQELDQRLADTNRDDLLTIIYTSGTTGQPKGVMLDYANFAAQFDGHVKRLTLNDTDISLCMLPLAHVLERGWTFCILFMGGINCYIRDINTMAEALKEIRPTVMSTVPRVFEKVFSKIHHNVSQASILKKIMFTWSVNMGARLVQCQQENKKPSWFLTISHRWADKLVLSKMRNLLGGRIRFMPCGGAALDETIGRFFHAIGINVKLGYGMTETTATISCWDDVIFHASSIGTLMPGAEVKIGQKNEILIRGPMVMRGYYKNPTETANSFDEHGFLKTGDAGRFDKKGNLFIIERIKDLMKTSGGKYIAPQMIEGTLGKDHFIEQIAVIADTRKFVSALIVPSFDSLEEYAKELNIKYRDRVELLKNIEVRNMLEERVKNMQQGLAKFEQVKVFKLLPKAFSIDKGEMTPTQKLRRKVIHKHYQKEIDDMYDENNHHKDDSKK